MSGAGGAFFFSCRIQKLYQKRFIACVGEAGGGIRTEEDELCRVDRKVAMMNVDEGDIVVRGGSIGAIIYFE